MDRPGDEFLAGSCLPQYEDRHIRRRNKAYEPLDLVHRLARPNKGIVGLFHPLKLLFEDNVPFFEGFFLVRFLDNIREFCQFTRFAQIIVGTKLHRLDGRIDGGVARKHYDLEIGLILLYGFQKLHAIHIGKPDIEHADVKGVLLHQGECFPGGKSRIYRQAITRELFPERLNKLFLVVNDQHADQEYPSFKHIILYTGATIP